MEDSGRRETERSACALAAQKWSRPDSVSFEAFRQKTAEANEGIKRTGQQPRQAQRHEGNRCRQRGLAGGGRRLVKKDPSVSQRSVQVVGSSWWPVEVEVGLPSLVVAAG
uniref:Uncharacterized protein n=1 Tax=Bionectria ochroleuca TaxID=29856 RepID=A0A8H7TPQ6_BIOOC